jgi:hypothetical protein
MDRKVFMDTGLKIVFESYKICITGKQSPKQETNNLVVILIMPSSFIVMLTGQTSVPKIGS